MRKCILILALALFCASALALPGANNNETKQLNESVIPFTSVNLFKLVEDKPIDPTKGFNATQVASGKNASINLVQAAPGSS